MPTIPVVRQVTPSDSGAAALTSVLRYYGKHVPLGAVRKVLGLGRDGTTIDRLEEACEYFGLSSRICESTHLLDSRDNLGAIFELEQRHFVVLERVRRANVVVIDPAFGRRTLGRAELAARSGNMALDIRKSPTFQSESRTDSYWFSLLHLLRSDWNTIGRILFISTVVQVFSAALPLMMGVLVDQVIPSGDWSLFQAMSVGYVSLQVFANLSTYLRSYLVTSFRSRLETVLSARVMSQLISLPLAFFQQRPAGDIFGRLGSAGAIKELITSTALSAVVDGLSMCVYFVLLLMASPSLLAFVLTLAAIRVYLLWLFRQKQKDLLVDSAELQARGQTVQIELVNGIETLKFMALESSLFNTWLEILKAGATTAARRSRLEATMTLWLGIVNIAGTATLTLYGAWLVIHGSLSLGAMLAYIALASNVLGPISSLAAAAMQLQMLDLFLERVSEVMAEAPEPTAHSSKPTRNPLLGTIRVESVGYSHNAGSSFGLEDVSFTVTAGQRVAIVGRSGSGKSTLLRVIAGLYPPTRGRVTIDGSDVGLADREWLRRQFGVVTQEPYVFAGSIRENICLGAADQSIDNVLAAAQMACLHDDVVAMPLAYETRLVDRGHSLSGGQRQRLALARALARKPAILILDEATSHLDGITEGTVLRNMKALECTQIVVAQRLATVRDADGILVIEDGRLIERGTHDELTSLDGFYASLCAQSQWAGSQCAR